MSIEQTDVVDKIGIDKLTGDAMLTIFDPLDWHGDQGMHLQLLQDKLNSYLRFVESGEMVEGHPATRKRRVIFHVIGRYPLSAEARKFYDIVSPVIAEAGFTLRFELMEDRTADTP